MIFFQNFGWLLVLIGVMILIHELGHYWAAIFFDVKVEAFSFGFGPRLFGFKKGETDYKFCLILFGGYVKMAGDQPLDELAPGETGEPAEFDPRGFNAKPRWQRLIIAFAGPFMNIIFAIGMLTALFTFYYRKPASAGGPAVVGHVRAESAAQKAGVIEGDIIAKLGDKADPAWDDIRIKEISGPEVSVPMVLLRGGKQISTTLTPAYNAKTGMGDAGWSEQNEIQIAQVLPGMNAEKAGLRKGDVLLAINGQPIRSTHKLLEVIKAANGAAVDILYTRNAQQSKMTVQPSWITTEGPGRWMVGVQLEEKVIITQLPLGEAFKESIRFNIQNAGAIYQGLESILQRRMSAKTLEGPIGIARLSGDAAREGPQAFFGLMSMVSLNLAIFNLLPIPILDGGVILMLLIEMLMRRDLSLNVKETVFKLGFVFLMAMVVFVLYNDITKILPS